MMLIVIALLVLVLLAILFPAFNRGTFLLFLILGKLALAPIFDDSSTMMLIVIAPLALILLAILSHSLYQGAAAGQERAASQHQRLRGLLAWGHLRRATRSEAPGTTVSGA
jgi:hypothetical protein